MITDYNKFMLGNIYVCYFLLAPALMYSRLLAIAACLLSQETMSRYNKYHDRNQALPLEPDAPLDGNISRSPGQTVPQGQQVAYVLTPPGVTNIHTQVPVPGKNCPGLRFQ